MKLFKLVHIEHAKRIVQAGFEGVQVLTMDDGTKVKIVEFVDVFPGAWEQSITTEVTVTEAGSSDSGGARLGFEVGGGPVMVTDGDIVLSIDVPRELVMPCEAHNDPPMGWRFREFWLPTDLANQHIDSLEACVFETEEQMPLSTLRAEHAVIVTERFTAFGGSDNPAPVGALCVCGERWRWSPVDGSDPRDELPGWLENHWFDGQTAA